MLKSAVSIKHSLVKEKGHKMSASRLWGGIWEWKITDWMYYIYMYICNRGYGWELSYDRCVISWYLSIALGVRGGGSTMKVAITGGMGRHFNTQASPEMETYGASLLHTKVKKKQRDWALILLNNPCTHVHLRLIKVLHNSQTEHHYGDRTYINRLLSPRRRRL